MPYSVFYQKHRRTRAGLSVQKYCTARLNSQPVDGTVGVAIEWINDGTSPWQGLVVTDPDILRELERLCRHVRRTQFSRGDTDEDPDAPNPEEQ